MSGDGGDSEDQEQEREFSREELLAMDPFALPSFSRRKTRYMALFDVEKWASELEEVSFATCCAPVAWDEAVAVQHCFQEGVCGRKDKLTEEDRAALERLRSKIGDLLAELQRRGAGGQGFFVRMGPRSPKDAPMMPSEPWGISEARVRDALKGVGLCSGSELEARDAMDVLRRFETVCYRLLRAASADEALALLVGSSRVMEDISHTLDHGEAGWDMSVVAREWNSEVLLEREFRTFVVGGRITAISQYHDQHRYDFVVERCDEIVLVVLRAMERLLPGLRRLGLDSPRLALVADFAVLPAAAGDGRSGGEAWTAKLVELNPFGPMTGASLFSWVYDRRLLQGGEDLFGNLQAHELRYGPGRSTPLPAFMEERTVEGVPFRYLVESAPGFTRDHLEAFWPDYLRLLRSEPDE